MIKAVIFSLVMTPIVAVALTLIGIVGGKITRRYSEHVERLAKKLTE